MNPDPPVDLLLPERSSSTSRAIRSLALRALFEWVKRTPRADAGPRYDAFRRAVESFLPGHPRVVTALLDEPGVSTPLRQLRRGVGDPRVLGEAIAATAAFVLEARGQRPASFDLDPAGYLCFDPARTRALPVGGRSLVLAASAAPFFSGVPELSDEALGERVARLRQGYDLLARALPGTSETLERLARVIVPSIEPFAFDPDALSVLGLSGEGDARALAEALAESSVTLVLATARERDPVGSALAVSALEAAGRAMVALELSRRLGEDAQRARFDEAVSRLEPLAGELSAFGRGVHEELVRYSRG